VVRNYCYTLRNMPDELRSFLLSVVSLKFKNVMFLRQFQRYWRSQVFVLAGRLEEYSVSTFFFYLFHLHSTLSSYRQWGTQI
jgi:hypothetical protein